MATRRGRRWAKRRSAVLGGILIAVFGVSVAIAVTSNNGLPGATGRTVRAAFSDVGALRVGDDVRIANVRVGQVKEITLTDGHPMVTLGFDGDRTVYNDAAALTSSVGARSALGQKYVDFRPGTPDRGELPADAVIPMAKTQDAQEISDLLRVLDEPTRQALGATLRETGGGMAGHGQDLRDALGALPGELPDMQRISAALNTDNGADLGQLLTAAERLSSAFDGRQQQLTDLTARLDSTMRALNVDGGAPLGSTLDKAPQAMRDVRASLGNLQDPLHQTEQAATALIPGARALGAATPDVRGLLREGVDPLGKVPGVARQAGPAVTDLTAVMTDAQPLAPRLTQAIGSAKDPLVVLAPYAPEASLFFSYATDALHEGDQAGHWLRFYPILNLESVDGTVPIADPTVARNAYPAPGQAAHDKKTTVLGERK